MDESYIVRSPEADWSEMADLPVELARSRRVQGTVFEKHILSKGTLLHPKTGAKIVIDDTFVDRMKENFRAGLCDLVQVPLANDKNEHVENPAANIGEVVGLHTRGDKVYAAIDVRDPAAVQKMGKTYLGASAFLSTNYTDSRTGTKSGPCLLHVAVTNRPYVVGLDDYRELPDFKIAATAADNTGEVVVLTAAPEETVPLSKEELLAALKNEHGLDVEALQASAAAPPAPDTAALTASVVQALRDSGYVSLSADPGTVSLGDVTAAVVELAGANKGLRSEVDELKLTAATTEVEGYIDAGRLLPKTRDVAISMALSNRDGLDAILAPANAPYVKLAHQKGVGGPDGEQRHEHDIDAEVARLAAEHSQFFSPNGTRQ
jgi:hypothetical protein